MKKIRYCYYLALALVLGCLAACSDSGEELVPDTPADGFCTLSIQIGASNNVETRAGDDENALAHEFMHELCVFVVSDGVIEKKLVTMDGTATPDDYALETGDAYEWQSNEFTLPSGEKIIYAFANWSTVTEGQEGGAWKAIIDRKEGEALSDADLSFAIDDPASQIQLSGSDMKFIPMSVKQTLNLAVSQTARIELIRLVGRVNVTVTNDKVSSLTVTSFKMGSFADKVPLMRGGSIGTESITYNKEYQVEDELTVEKKNSSSFNFYINETENNHAFNIALVADEKNYSATTTTTNIPRNNILPLNLKISESDLDLVVTVYINSIGSYPVNVITSNDLTSAATYNVTVPEGASFQVTGTVAGMTEGNGACVLSYYGAADGTNIQINETDPSWAHVASLSGLTGDNITPLTVSYQVNGAERASCRLNVTTEPLKDLDDYNIQTTGLYLRSWCAAPRWYEPINLMIEQ